MKKKPKYIICDIDSNKSFNNLDDMLEYHNSKRPWIIAKWEDWIWYPIYRFVRWTIWDRIRPGAIKHYYQRARYGYSYMDTWNVGSHIVEILIPMLEKLKKDRYGTPIGFYKEEDGVDDDGNPTEEAQKLADARYDNVLGEMIFGLKCGRKLINMDYDFCDSNEHNKLTSSAKRSFELFGEYWQSLWN